MDWLNNANTITSLVLAMIGIGGSLYGAVSYLKKKASGEPPSIENVSQKQSPSSSRQSIILPKITWLEWTEFLAQGLVDMVDFILHLCLQNDEIDDEPVVTRLGWGLFCYGIGLGVGTLILWFIIGLLFTGLGIHDPSGASGVIAFMLLFAVLSFIYIYHVGLRVERKRQEQYKSSKQQQRAQQ